MKIDSKDFESMEQLANTINCEIKCGDFYFNGMCADKKEIFDFMSNQSICGVSE